MLSVLFGFFFKIAVFLHTQVKVLHDESFADKIIITLPATGMIHSRFDLM